MDVDSGQPSNAAPTKAGTGTGTRSESSSASPSPSPPTSPTKEKGTTLKGEVEPSTVEGGQPEGASPDGKTPRGGRNKNPSIKIRKQYSKIYRIKTKILQNLGKADKTTDEVFDDYEANFNRQQANANKLQREVSNYLRCARALHGASKALFETLSEVYEPQWVGHDLVYVQASNSDMLWTDFCHKLQDQTLNPLTTYSQDFPEIRKKIDKRGRKLVDYDSQRHQLENLQRATRRDEYKIARAKDQLETARSTYEAMNKELYDELPVLFDQRIPRISDCLQTMYAAEATFMAESSKISSELESISDKLHGECQKGTYNAQRSSPPKAKVNLNLSNQSNQSVELSPAKHSPTVWYDINPPKTNNRQEADRLANEGVGGSGAPGEIAPVPVQKVARKASLKKPPPPPVVELNGFGETKKEEKSFEIKEKIEENGFEIKDNNAIDIDASLVVDKVEDDTVEISLNTSTDDKELPDDIDFERVEKQMSSDSDIEAVASPPKPPHLPPPSPTRDMPSPTGDIPSPIGELTSPVGELPSPTPSPREPEPGPSSLPIFNEDAEDKNRPAISSPISSGEPARPYEDIEFEEKKVNGSASPKTNGQISGQTIPEGATTAGLPEGVLYRVRATYKYVREDVDELGFDVGEVIDVVEYDDPEEQEEGWLCGRKESSDDKGLFPANFTRPI